MNFGGDHPAHSYGKISPRCVPEGASDEKNTGSWQHVACMYSNTANFGKICVLCVQKDPQSAVGEYTARTSCHQGALSPSEALRSCTAHESCRPPVALPPAPRQYLPPANTCRLPCPLQPETSRRWTSAAIIRRMPAVRPSPEGPPTAPSRRAGRQRNAAQNWA